MSYIACKRARVMGMSVGILWAHLMLNQCHATMLHNIQFRLSPAMVAHIHVCQQNRVNAYSCWDHKNIVKMHLRISYFTRCQNINCKSTSSCSRFVCTQRFNSFTFKTNKKNRTEKIYETYEISRKILLQAKFHFWSIFSFWN